MMYRATPLAHSYVQALNLIDVVFNADSKKEKAVRTGWKVLLNHLDKGKGKPDFFEQSQNHTSVLLAAMGACLGYEFDELYLKQHAYQPQGHGQIEEEQNAIRRLQLQVLQGTRRLPIAIFPDQFPEVVLPPGDTKPFAKRANAYTRRARRVSFTRIAKPGADETVPCPSITSPLTLSAKSSV